MSTSQENNQTHHRDKSAHTDDLVQRASNALHVGNCFEAERIAGRALAMTREARDYQRMAKVAEILLQTRRERLQQALDANVVHYVEQSITENTQVEPGGHIVFPLLVGADARRLRLLAFEREVPVAVLCCEPATTLGQWPIVAVTPGYTMRTRVEPPDDRDEPDLDWLAWAVQQLGDFAIESIDEALEPHRRVEALLERLDALPEHENLNRALIEACQTAHKRQVEAAERKAARASKVKS